MAAKKKAQTTPAATQSKKDSCFTIMPFGGWFDNYYETIYKPAIEAAGLIPCRADDLYRPGTIVNDIWTYTKESKIILADLTGKNPNVFYELGLAHALAKPAILIAETISDVPFDLRALRVIEYDKNIPNWGARLQEKIETSIREIIKAPLESVLPAFLKIRDSQKDPSVTKQEREFIEIKQEMALLRRQLSRVPDAREVQMNPSDAKIYIRRSIDRGMSRDMIIDRLTEKGVPSRWINDQIDALESEVSLKDEAKRLTSSKFSSRTSEEASLDLDTNNEPLT
jgi:hypothetical protein